MTAVEGWCSTHDQPLGVCRYSSGPLCRDLAATLAPGEPVLVRGPGGWVEGRFRALRSAEVNEDFSRIDVGEINGVGAWLGCHPKNVRRP